MRKSTALIRTSALPAIAAALALSSTPLLAQQVTPSTSTDPAASTTTTPATTTAPAEQTAPVTTDTAAPAADAGTTSSSTTTTSAAPATHVARTTRHVTRSAAPVAPVATTRVATRTVTRAPASAAPAAPAAPTAPAAQPATTPAVDMSAQSAPAPATAAPARTNNGTSNMLPIAAGGLLALLVVGVLAYAMMRRRRHVEDDMWVEDETTYDHAEPEPMMHDEPPAMENAMAAEQPTIVAPPVSAFAWGNEAKREEQRSEEPMVEDERMPGESWIQRAYRGPSASNPSVSLKARLKRAAFFDKRERDAAAGLAEPVDTTAGLPEALVEEQESENA